jgi:hypothetical protein
MYLGPHPQRDLADAAPTRSLGNGNEVLPGI